MDGFLAYVLSRCVLLRENAKKALRLSLYEFLHPIEVLRSRQCYDVFEK